MIVDEYPATSAGGTLTLAHGVARSLSGYGTGAARCCQQFWELIARIGYSCPRPVMIGTRLTRKPYRVFAPLKETDKGWGAPRRSWP